MPGYNNCIAFNLLNCVGLLVPTCTGVRHVLQNLVVVDPHVQGLTRYSGPIIYNVPLLLLVLDRNTF